MNAKYLKISNSILDFPRFLKRLIAVSVDVSLCLVSTWAAFSLRFSAIIYPSKELFLTAVISISICIPVFVLYGLYRAIFRYHGLAGIYELCKAMLIYVILFTCIISFVGINGVPRTVGVIQPLLLFVFVWLSRSAVQFSLGQLYENRIGSERVPKALIYGAGRAGRQLALSVKNSLEVKAVGFLDDDKTIQGQQLHGLKVSSPELIKTLILKNNISYILLAMPSLDRSRRNEIIKKIGVNNISVRTVPSLTDIAQGRVTNSEILALNLEDLLGRDAVEPNPALLSKNIFQKTVLVTGAGGSIGSELCRQIVKLGCQKLILVDFNEYSLYSLISELNILVLKSSKLQGMEIIPILASVQQKNMISKIVRDWKPYIIYHAAAYKHVPLVEENLVEGVANNVISSMNIAQVALEYGVSYLVYVSTDKAVRPTNVMGASKRLAEIALQSFFDHNLEKSDCKLAIVRFGNVLESSGSVLPKFRKQIQDGGPITLTHPKITRYFMTIPEAAQLVIQAAAMSGKGDVFVLDMGEPIKIINLAHRMVELSGLSVKTTENPSGDIEILVTGLRPGEKLFEELLIENDARLTEHAKIFRASDPIKKWKEIEPVLESLKIHLDEQNSEAILNILTSIVKNYSPSDSIIMTARKEN